MQLDASCNYRLRCGWARCASRSTASFTASNGDLEGLKGTAVSKEISSILIPKYRLSGQKPSNWQTQHC
jgi:hypothetical protein